MNKLNDWFLLVIVLIALSGNACAERYLLNVSYDPTRELYQAFNKKFVADWKAKTGETVVVRQSHGGAGEQAEAVIDGLAADILTLALPYDIDRIAAKTGKLSKDWQQRLPNNGAPYTSTIVFLVRKGNPKGIKDWDDLVKSGVAVITPNPKTSSGARYNYLAAWAFAEKQYGGKKAAKDFVKKLYKNVPVLDSGARGATTTFVQGGIGDVLLAWENEALRVVEGQARGRFEVVVPPTSILAEPPAAIVDAVVAKHGTRDLAEAYLDYLFSSVGQQLSARYYFRPFLPELADLADLARFPNLKLFSVDELFGGWQQAQAVHFSDGGTFDQLYDANTDR